MADTYSTITIDEITEVSTATDDDLFVISQNSSTKTITKDNLLSPLQVQINELADIIESGGSGLTDGAKQALLNCLAHVAWIDEHGQDYYDALEDALYPPVTAISISPTALTLSAIGETSQLTATTTPSGGNVTWASSNTSVATVSSSGLVTSVGYGSCTITASSGSVSASCSVSIIEATVTSISAVYTQSGTVYDTDSLDDLKADLVVTAYFDNDTSQTVTSYTLSGTLTVGTSTITVSYGGQTTTFDVTVSEYVVPALYELSSPVTFDGSTNAVNTNVILQPSSNTDTDWTIVLEYVDTSSASGNIFDFGYDGTFNIHLVYMTYNSNRNRWSVYAVGGQSANAWLSASFGETERWVITHAQGDTTVTAYQKRGTNEAETSVITRTYTYDINVLAQTVPIVIGGTYDSSNAISTLVNGVTINDFRIYDSAWDSASASNYLENGR